jgi:hypothetical protein
MVRTANRRFMFMVMTGILLLALPAIASAQGRGHGWGRGGSDKSWKCGKFVNCHDARDGRVDGRGPNRSSGIWQNGVYYPNGTNVRYGRGRYSTNDYWRRRHVMNDNDYWRHRNVMNNNDYWRHRRVTNDTYRNRRWRER